MAACDRLAPALGAPNQRRMKRGSPPGRLPASRPGASRCPRPATNRKQRRAALGTVALPTGPTVGQGYLVRVGDRDLLAAHHRPSGPGSGAGEFESATPTSIFRVECSSQRGRQSARNGGGSVAVRAGHGDHPRARALKSLDPASDQDRTPFPRAADSSRTRHPRTDSARNAHTGPRALHDSHHVARHRAARFGQPGPRATPGRTVPLSRTTSCVSA